MGLWKPAVLVIITAAAVVWIPKLLQPKRPPVVGGFALPEWKQVETQFRTNVESGEDRGGSLAVYYKGELVLHLYGGYADEEVGLPWKENTMACYYSATKGVAAIVIAHLVERGFLDYNKPVSTYWPDFAKHGKDKVTVTQLVSHQAGLVVTSEPIFAREMVENPEKVGRILADSKPLWALGEGHGYHGISIGLLLDQLVRRTDPKHRSLGQYFSEEIAKPFDIDFYIGLPREEHYRVARQTDPTPLGGIYNLLSSPKMFYLMLLLPKDSLLHRMGEPIKDLTKYPQGYINIPEIREVPLSSAFGIGTPRGMAKLWGILANGGQHQGKTLLKVPSKLAEPVTSGEDKVILMNITWGLGTMLASSEGRQIIGHTGFGGQHGYMDPSHRLSWSYVSNHIGADIMTGGEKYFSLQNSIYDVVNKLENQ